MDKVDEIEKFFFCCHVYLLEFQRALLERAESFSDVWVDDEEILHNINEFRPEVFSLVKRSDFDHAVSYLRVADYLEMFRITGGGEPPMTFIKLTDEGIIKMMSGHFLMMQDERRRTLESVQLSREAKKQGWWSVRLAAISGLFILVTIYQTEKSKTDTRLQEISKSMQMQDNSLKSIQICLEEIGDAIRVINEKTSPVEAVKK